MSYQCQHLNDIFKCKTKCEKFSSQFGFGFLHSFSVLFRLCSDCDFIVSVLFYLSRVFFVVHSKVESQSKRSGKQQHSYASKWEILYMCSRCRRRRHRRHKSLTLTIFNFRQRTSVCICTSEAKEISLPFKVQTKMNACTCACERKKRESIVCLSDSRWDGCERVCMCVWVWENDEFDARCATASAAVTAASSGNKDWLNGLVDLSTTRDRTQKRMCFDFSQSDFFPLK